MSDWWQPSGQPGPSALGHLANSTSSPGGAAFHTPTRGALGGSRATRFNVADDLDPEDARMAENIRFAPSFAASPAGKLVMGNHAQQGALSPNNGPGTGGGGNSPPGGSVRPGQSPRRYTGAEGAASPRNVARQKAQAQQIPDEDMPPTAMLRDTPDSPARPMVPPSGPVQLPTPPALIPSSHTTKLLVFGPPPSLLPSLESYLAEIGELRSYTPGPEGTNWWVVEYVQPLAAAFALRRHGEVLGGKWMIGVRVAEGVTSDGDGGRASPTNGNGGQHGGVDVYRSSGPGRAMTIQKDKSVIRPKAVAGPKVEGGWDESEGQGRTTRLAEWLFGR